MYTKIQLINNDKGEARNTWQLFHILVLKHHALILR